MGSRSRQAARALRYESLEQRVLLSVSPPPAGQVLDLGTVDFLTRPFAAAESSGVWYKLVATNSGLLSAISGTQPNQAGQELIAVFRAANGQLDPIGSGVGRVDASVVQGQTYYVMVVGASGGESLWLANLVCQAGSNITVAGTRGDDQIDVALGSAGKVTVNGIEYALSGTWSTILVDAGQGQDSVTISSSYSAEQATMSSLKTTVRAQGRSVEVSGTERVTVSVSSTAVVEINDGPADDQVTFSPGMASITGGGFMGTVSGASTIHAYARNGGFDSVTFLDSSGSDQANYRDDIALFKGEGFYNRAKFFEAVHFTSTNGEDTAWLLGTNRSDRLYGELGDVSLQAGDATVRATGFWTTFVRSGGGSDFAEVNDSPDDDFVFSFPGEVTLFNQQNTLQVNGFAYTHIYARYGGYDTAYFYDSPGDDVFVGRAEFSSLTTSPYFVRAKFFDAVHAYSRSGGNDLANLYDSPGNDTLTLRPLYARMEGPGFVNRVETFGRVIAKAETGRDTARVYGSDSAEWITFQGQVTDVVFGEGGTTGTTAATLRGFAEELFMVQPEDQIVRTASRAVIDRGEPSAVIDAADYYDPAAPDLGFQRAIDALPATGGVVQLPKGVFQLRKGLVLRSNVTLLGDPSGTTLVRADQLNAWVTAPGRPGDQAIEVASTAGFRIGDEFVLVSGRYNYSRSYVIVGIDGNRLLLDRPLEDLYLPDDNAEVTNLFSVVRATGTAENPVVNVRIENLTLNGNLKEKYRLWAASAPGTLQLSYAANSQVRNVTVTKSPTTGIVLQNGHDNLIVDSSVADARRNCIALFWEQDSLVRGVTVRGGGYDMSSKTDWGEGILVSGGRDVHVEDCLAENNLGKGLHPAGDLKIGGLWINNISRNNGSNGFHYCNNNFGVWAVNNQLYGNAGYGVGGLGLGGEYRDRFNVVMNNFIYNNGQSGIHVNGGRDNYILNNVIGPNSTRKPGQFPEIRLGEVWTTTIQGNKITPNPGALAVDTTFVQLFSSIQER